jgi:hypothetical protein
VRKGVVNEGMSERAGEGGIDEGWTKEEEGEWAVKERVSERVRRMTGREGMREFVYM